MSQPFWSLALLSFLLSRSALSVLVTESSCSTVVLDLFPCLDFVDGNEKDPSAACCSGVNHISDMAKDKADAIAICECLKRTMDSMGTLYDPNLVAQLPKKCKLNVTIPPIKGDTDCTKFGISNGSASQHYFGLG